MRLILPAHWRDMPFPCKDRWLCTSLIAVILLAFAIRVHLASMPLERDEGEYGYIAQRMLQGIPPYKSGYTVKFPGTHVAYAVILKAFGQTDTAIRWGLIVVNALTMIFIYRIARTLAGNVQKENAATTGLWAAAVFAIMSLAPSMLGITANAEHFALLPAAAGTLMLLRGPSRFCIYSSGVYMGLAICMKQPAIAFALAGLAGVGFGAKTKTPKDICISCALYIAGVATLLLIMVFCIQGAGVFREFRFWCFTYAQHYGGMWGLADGARHFALKFEPVLADHLLIFVACAAGLWMAWRKNREAFWVMLGVLIAGFAATAPGLIFRPHYFIFIVPGVSVAAAFGLASLGRWAPAGILALLWPLGMQQAVFRADPEQASRLLYPNNAFVETRALGYALGKETLPGEWIGILGSEPQICFYAQRPLITPYVYMYPLMEPQPFAKSMQQDLMGRLEYFPPRIMIHVRMPTSWLVYRNSDMTLLNWMPKYLETNYLKERSIPCPKGTEIIVYKAK